MSSSKGEAAKPTQPADKNVPSSSQVSGFVVFVSIRVFDLFICRILPKRRNVKLTKIQVCHGFPHITLLGAYPHALEV